VAVRNLLTKSVTIFAARSDDAWDSCQSKHITMGGASGGKL